MLTYIQRRCCCWRGRVHHTQHHAHAYIHTCLHKCLHTYSGVAVVDEDGCIIHNMSTKDMKLWVAHTETDAEKANLQNISIEDFCEFLCTHVCMYVWCMCVCVQLDDKYRQGCREGTPQKYPNWTFMWGLLENSFQVYMYICVYWVAHTETDAEETRLKNTPTGDLC